MAKLRAAVVGAGRLGSLHARKYAALGDVSLDFIVDIDATRAAELATEVGAMALADYRALAGKVDLVTVASPGVTHHEVACALLDAGIDVLLEKPMAATLAQAHELAALAARSGRVLQIGHLERFNPAVVQLHSIVNKPRFVECHRLASFTERGTDVDVVLDLMVHDLDVIMSVAPSEIASLEAVGVAILTDRIDLANARIRFQSGLIANLVTSRVSAKRERKIRFFQPDAYISVDYEARRIQIYRKSPPPPGAQFPVISADQIDFGEADPLAEEVRSFVDAVRSRSKPQVSADDGLRVMELTDRIKQVMETGAASDQN
jgi:predicted dehydrogenase